MKRIAAVVALSIALACTAAHAADPALKVLKTIPIGGAARGWDYLTVDSDSHRLYVAHGSQIDIVDLDSDKVLGNIPAIGAHGIAIVPEANLGFSTNGRDNSVTEFDLKTLKPVRNVKSGSGPDAITYDPASKHVFAIDHAGGDITVIDPAAPEKALATIPVGGKLEFAVTDGNGHLFVNVEDKSEVVEIDSKANRVLAHWALAPNEGPTGLAIDITNKRLFAGCDGSATAAVLDADSGKILAAPKVGQGVDGAAFEPGLGIAIIPNGKDGTASIIKETSPGKFEVVQTLTTLKGARTITVDPKSHRAYMPTNVPDGKGGNTFGVVVLGTE